MHLLKMCVGIDSVEHLRRAQRRRLERLRAAGEPELLRHWTRHAPLRADEILAGGSLYWIIKGFVRCRQRITAIERTAEGPAMKSCALVLAPELVETELRPARAMQGWRYLAAADAPPDRPAPALDDAALPPELARELRALGLL